MKNIDNKNKGLYSRCKERIRGYQLRDTIVVDANNLASCFDVSNLARDELERYYKAIIARIALYDSGYRSVVRGKGYYVDMNKCYNPYYLQALKNNAKASAEQKKNVEEIVTAVVDGNISEIPNYQQYAFDFDNSGEYSQIDSEGHYGIKSEISMDDLLKMLDEEAKRTESGAQ